MLKIVCIDGKRKTNEMTVVTRIASFVVSIGCSGRLGISTLDSLVRDIK